MATSVQRASQLTMADMKGKVDPDWCPGCGDFGVLAAVQKALVELRREAVIGGMRRILKQEDAVEVGIEIRGRASYQLIVEDGAGSLNGNGCRGLRGEVVVAGTREAKAANAQVAEGEGGVLGQLLLHLQVVLDHFGLMIFG